MIKKVWFDITNTPHVHFLLAIQKTLGEEITGYLFTTRDFSETVDLLRNRLPDNNLIILNTKYGKSYLSKLVSIITRLKRISEQKMNYDLSISCGSEAAIWYSRLKGKRTIAFGDNDTARQWTYGRFVDYSFFPAAIDRNILERQGLKNKLYQYHGLKEDIYISYFKPDKRFKSRIPFNEYIVVRPENVHANYLRNSTVKSITPSLLRILANRGYKVIYLPRYTEDISYADGLDNIFIPNSPINGLDLCYHSNAVITGAGTLAREAACLEVPAFSFYAGKELLAVDKQLINDNKIYYSRDPNDIADRIKYTKRSELNFSRSISVREEVKNKLLEVISMW